MDYHYLTAILQRKKLWQVEAQANSGGLKSSINPTCAPVGKP
jgi:hypothetical protein